MNKNAIIIFLILLSTINASVVKQKNNDASIVKKQYQSDMEKKEAIIKRINDLMNDINTSVLGKEKLVVPIDPNKANDVIDHDDYVQKEESKNQKAHSTKDDGTLIAPTKGKTSSNFGYRKNPVTKKYSFHKGIDIAAPKGTIVVASASGKVVSSQYMMNGYGNCVIIEHDNDIKTLYAHLEKRTVQSGQTVTQGQQIGTVGATGRATGPHLHYEVYKGKQAINPIELLHY